MCCTVPLNARLEAGTGTGDYISFVACCHRFERNKDDNEDRAKLPRRLRNEILSSFFNPIQLRERNKTKLREKGEREKWPSPLEKYSHEETRGCSVNSRLGLDSYASTAACICTDD